MNITFVINTLGYGGATKMMLFVAEGLMKRGHTVSIVNLNTTGSFRRLPSELISLKSANISYQGTLKTNYKWIKFILDSVQDFQSDIIIGFLPIGNFGASLAAKLLHIPSIISERGDPSATNVKPTLLSRLKLKIINSADGAVFQTEGASKFYSKKLQRKSTIIPNPIFIDSTIPNLDYNNRPKSIVSLGRIANKQKRLDIMIKSFLLFKKNHPDYVLNIYGNGPDEDYLNNLIVEMGLTSSVFLKGVSINPFADMSKEGIFLITSDYEGISNSLLEAMAIGLPVVSTDHSPGGARLLITDHENGLLAPIRDIEAIANSLSEFADNPKLAEKCGKKAKEVLIRFSPDNALNSWENYITKVVSNCNG